MDSFCTQFLLAGIPAALVFACFGPYRRRALEAQHLHSSFLRELTVHLFVAYLFGLAAMILWPGYHWTSSDGLWGDLVLHTGRDSRLSQVNLVPMRTITMFLRMLLEGKRYDPTVNLLGNVLVFLPLGFLPALLFRPLGPFHIWIIGIGFSGSCEFLQYFLGRNCDVDDLILNVAGVLLGYWLCLQVQRRFPRITRHFYCTK